MIFCPRTMQDCRCRSQALTGMHATKRPELPSCLSRPKELQSMHRPSVTAHRRFSLWYVSRHENGPIFVLNSFILGFGGTCFGGSCKAGTLLQTAIVSAIIFNLGMTSPVSRFFLGLVHSKPRHLHPSHCRRWNHHYIDPLCHPFLRVPMLSS